MDGFFKKKPTHAKIIEFEKIEDPDNIDHWYGIKDDELQIAMFAASYEEGIPYFGVNMAFDSAKTWQKDPISKHVKLFSYLNLIVPLITMIFAYFIVFKSQFAAILINIIGTGIIIYFFIIRFKELFKATEVYLPEEIFDKYAKLGLSGFKITYFFQFFIAILMVLSWFVAFSKGI
ncbi:MAG: hypothetical protein ACTSWX_03735 [Promethearchaeota archaeon]